MPLQFTDELPPGARVIDGGNRGRGINKDEVRAQLRSQPGKWALVYGTDEYNAANEATANDWRRKEKGFEAAVQVIEHTKTDANGNKVSRGKWRWKVWLRYVGVPGTVDPSLPDLTEPDGDDGIQDQHEISVMDHEEPIDVAIVPPVPRRPSIPNKPDTRTAFQMMYEAETEPSSPTFE